MLLSRFWYVILAFGCAAAFAAALMTQAAFNRQYDQDLNDKLRRDRLELELMLKADARSRIDAIAPLAAHGDVRSALRQASRRDDADRVDSELRAGLEDKLQGLNRQLEGMSGDLLFALDDDGYIIAQLGAGDPPAGASLGQFPLVQRALAGYVRDDVWIYNGKVYRMAARPVIDSGGYAGAIVHGMELDDELARRLAERLNGATVAFFQQDHVIASHMPTEDQQAARAEDVEGGLGEAVQDEDLQSGGRTAAIDLGGGSRGVYSLVTGSAGEVGVGYAIARPRHVLGSVWDVFGLIAIDDVDQLPLPILIGAIVLLIAIMMLFLWIEHDRHMSKMRKTTAALAKREIDRLTVTDFGGRYRSIATNVNEAMDKAVESAAAASPKRKAADLDEILGPTPEGKQSPQFFGFAPGAGGDQQDIPSVPPEAGPGTGPEGAPKLPGGPPPAPAGAPGGPPPGAPPKPAGGPPAAPPRPGAPPAPGGAPKPPPPAAPPRPAGGPPGAPPPPAAKAPGAPAAGPTPGVDDKPDWQKGTLMGVGQGGEAAGGAGPVQKPGAAAPPPAAAGGGAPAGESFDEDDEEGATMIADVPRELLDAASTEEGIDKDADERHFKEVFDKFVATKKECGEPTGGLTFDKFVQTLRKNRDQIVSRHGAKTVRFTVYVKDGKAALKATPVKE